MNSDFESNFNHFLQTHLQWMTVLTGSLERISIATCVGKSSMNQSTDMKVRRLEEPAEKERWRDVIPDVRCGGACWW